MNTLGKIKETAGYFVVVLITFAGMQSIVVVMHEFTHSTVAWLLGDMSSPFGIVWGNPLMMTGWDEGVAIQAFTYIHTVWRQCLKTFSRAKTGF